MTQNTKIRIVKRIIKATIAIVVLTTLVVLSFFVKHNYTFEHSSMIKWPELSEKQRNVTLQRVAPDSENSELLMQCVTKISQLPDSEKMDIRDAIVICSGGIKANLGDGTK